MRVYHYLPAEWGLDDIRRRRLKFSKIDDMNDPYEFRCVCSSEELSQAALESTLREVVQRFGALCFSSSWNNILMWSHYGDRHKGMCLGFDVPDDPGITRPVEYVGEVQVVGDIVEPSMSVDWTEQGTEIVDRLLGMKYRGWCYEKEIRVNPRREQMDERTGFYFVDFGEILKLKEVIAGARFSMGRRSIEDALSGYSEDVQIVKAAASKARFEIVVDDRGF